MNEPMPNCYCGRPEDSDGLNHENFCPYATWYARRLYAAQQARQMIGELREAAQRFLRATGSHVGPAG